jgi:hypothetical protein
VAVVYLVGGAAGGTVYALFTAWALRRVIPTAETAARTVVETWAPAAQQGA